MSGMRRVMILSYFYPPCSLTAAQRPASWAKYLPEFGFFPLVVTRCWDAPVREPRDMFRGCGSTPRVESDGRKEAHLVPYRPTLRDRIYLKHGDTGRVQLRRGLSLAESLVEHLSPWVGSYSPILDRADDLLRRDPTIDRMVVTAGPVTMFRLGHELARRHPRLRWVADYRDEWTSEPRRSRSPLDRLLRLVERRSERRWVGSASHVTSVSPGELQRICALTGRPGTLVLNGFDEESLAKLPAEPPKVPFRITYAGTLYPSQPVEIFLQGVMRVIRRWQGRLPVEVLFPGLAFSPDQAERVATIVAPLRDRFTITARMPHEEAVAIERSSHVLLLLAHEGRNDVPSSKLYEYLTLRKPVLLCPDDQGVMSATLRSCGLGIIASTAAEVETRLDELISEHVTAGGISVQPRGDTVELFSRRVQCGVLAQVLHSLNDARRPLNP